MSQSKTKSKKAVSGMGNIRKITKTTKGKEYTYYEARYTAGYDPGTGKQIQRSISGKTQREVTQKLKEVLAALDTGTYIEPCKITVGQWLDTWSNEYLGAVKPSTICSYKATIKTHLKPGLGAIKLDSLDVHIIQSFYNGLLYPKKNTKGISPKTVKNVHGVLHKALEQAVYNGYIHSNPTNGCVLPRVEKKQIKPLDEDQIASFIRAVKGHQYEHLFVVTLFSGMREAEALGLTWDCVDFEKSTITINKQLQLIRGTNGEYKLAPTKNSKVRLVTVAPYVLSILTKVKAEQEQNQILFGRTWNKEGFVFTNPAGEHLRMNTVYKNFKAIVRSLGYDEARFHDLRHSYAVACIKSGDDIKTVQENLGHATASFTLDVYGHVTNRMKQASAARMEQFIHEVAP